MRIRRVTTFSICLFVMLLGAWLVVEPVSGEVSFSGKTVRIVISSRAGGGTDRTARLVGKLLPKYLPGNPKVIYQNMPGGDGIKAANYMTKKAKPDGLSVLQAHSTMISPLLLKRDVVKYDPLKFGLIGAVNRGGSLIIIRKDARKRLNNRSEKPVVIGALSGTRTWNAMIVWGAEFLGWNVKWVTGYPGTDALTTALLQGEIDMTGTSNAFLIRGLKEEGVVDLITQPGILSGGKYLRRSSFRDVPTMPKLLRAKKLKEIEWKGYLSWVGAGQVDKWMALPPNTPKKYLQAFRRAFDQATKDPKFLSRAKAVLSQDVKATSGKELEDLIKEVVGISDEALAYSAKLRKKYGLPEN